ncbi:MAG: FMN-binding protein [Clostridia bacterium]|nr:FMN-binding protein [Clostridia bacterium]
MKKHIWSVLSLTLICAVVAVALALTNALTAPIIEERQNAAANESLAVVLPGGEGFEKVDMSKYAFPATITEVYSEKNGGYVFQMKTTGYKADFVLMCGIDKDGVVAGTACISSGETLGAEATYGEQLKGQKVDTIDGVATVSGATKTTAAYRGAVKDALNAFVILGGGSVDLRDPAQILADNLAAALPAGEGKFTPVFITEEMTNISAVYKADNGAGYVFVSGETFVATDAAGVVQGDVAAELKATLEVEAPILIGSTLTEIDLSAFPEPLPATEKAFITSTGNYVLELRAAGYGIQGEYHTSGEYIRLKVALTPAGKIIACETVSQSETAGVGDICANPDYYTQYNGKDATTYEEVDTVAGATVTTGGYRKAIANAFQALEMLIANEK